MHHILLYVRYMRTMLGGHPFSLLYNEIERWDKTFDFGLEMTAGSYHLN